MYTYTIIDTTIVTELREAGFTCEVEEPEQEDPNGRWYITDFQIEHKQTYILPSGSTLTLGGTLLIRKEDIPFLPPHSW